MTIKAIKKISEEWFTPQDQKKEEVPARFRVKPLTGLEHAEVMSGLRQEGEVFVLNSAAIKAAIKYGLVGWENIEDEKGKEIEFNQANLKYIPGHYLYEVGGYIFRKSNLSEEEEKKPE